MVSIHRPLGYGPSTLPLRHSAVTYSFTESVSDYPQASLGTDQQMKPDLEKDPLANAHL